jgi:hypothetical protein
VPSEGSRVDGFPLGPADTVGLLLVAWIAAHRVRLRGAGAAATVIGAVAIAMAAVPGHGGMRARYFATDAGGSTHERSTEYRDPAFTRVDRRLDFVPAEHDFPLAFFNDHARFNFTQPGDPDRRYLPFAVSWNGWWWVEAGTHTLYVNAPGATAEIAIDASPLLRVAPESGEQTATITLTRGWHRLHATIASPYGAPRAFSAGEFVDGERRAFDAQSVRTERLDSRQMIVVRALRVFKPIADALILAWLSSVAALLLLRHIGDLWQRGVAAAQAAIALFMVGVVAEGLRFAWPWAGRFRVMIGGDDPMTYEAYARDILFNGLLMNGGLPLGQGEPFYYQPFYPYFLAATHFVFGEGMFGVLFLQRVLVGLTAVILTRMAMKLRGDAIWPTALIVSALFVWWKFAPIAADLLNESIYIPLLAAWAASLITLCLGPRLGLAARTGVLAGLTAIARSTSVLAWVFVWPAIFWQMRGVRVRTKLFATLVACSLAVFSLVATRNWLVSHRFVPVSTEFGVTLAGGNLPPEGLLIAPANRRWLYETMGVGGHTAQTIEYAIVAPGSFAANIGRKALFALGFYEPYAPGWGYSPVYIAVWLSAIAGLFTTLRSPIVPRIPVLLPLMIALTQFVAVVVVYPKGERLILPIYILLVPYAAIACHLIACRLAGISTSSSAEPTRA